MAPKKKNNKKGDAPPSSTSPPKKTTRKKKEEKKRTRKRPKKDRTPYTKHKGEDKGHKSTSRHTKEGRKKGKEYNEKMSKWKKEKEKMEENLKLGIQPKLDKVVVTAKEWIEKTKPKRGGGRRSAETDKIIDDEVKKKLDEGAIEDFIINEEISKEIDEGKLSNADIDKKIREKVEEEVLFDSEIGENEEQRSKQLEKKLREDVKRDVVTREPKCKGLRKRDNECEDTVGCKWVRGQGCKKKDTEDGEGGIGVVSKVDKRLLLARPLPLAYSSLTTPVSDYIPISRMLLQNEEKKKESMDSYIIQYHKLILRNYYAGAHDRFNFTIINNLYNLLVQDFLMIKAIHEKMVENNETDVRRWLDLFVNVVLISKNFDEFDDNYGEKLKPTKRGWMIRSNVGADRSFKDRPSIDFLLNFDKFMGKKWDKDAGSDKMQEFMKNKKNINDNYIADGQWFDNFPKNKTGGVYMERRSQKNALRMQDTNYIKYLRKVAYATPSFKERKELESIRDEVLSLAISSWKTGWDETKKQWEVGAKVQYWSDLLKTWKNAVVVAHELGPEYELDENTKWVQKDFVRLDISPPEAPGLGLEKSFEADLVRARPLESDDVKVKELRDRLAEAEAEVAKAEKLGERLFRYEYTFFHQKERHEKIGKEIVQTQNIITKKENIKKEAEDAKKTFSDYQQFKNFSVKNKKDMEDLDIDKDEVEYKMYFDDTDIFTDFDAPSLDSDFKKIKLEKVKDKLKSLKEHQESLTNMLYQIFFENLWNIYSNDYDERVEKYNKQNMPYELVSSMFEEGGEITSDIYKDIEREYDNIFFPFTQAGIERVQDDILEMENEDMSKDEKTIINKKYYTLQFDDTFFKKKSEYKDLSTRIFYKLYESIMRIVDMEKARKKGYSTPHDKQASEKRNVLTLDTTYQGLVLRWELTTMMFTLLDIYKDQMGIMKIKLTYVKKKKDKDEENVQIVDRFVYEKTQNRSLYITSAVLFNLTLGTFDLKVEKEGTKERVPNDPTTFSSFLKEEDEDEDEDEVVTSIFVENTVVEKLTPEERLSLKNYEEDIEVKLENMSKENLKILVDEKERDLTENRETLNAKLKKVQINLKDKEKYKVLLDEVKKLEKEKQKELKDIAKQYNQSKNIALALRKKFPTSQVYLCKTCNKRQANISSDWSLPDWSFSACCAECFVNSNLETGKEEHHDDCLNLSNTQQTEKGKTEGRVQNPKALLKETNPKLDEKSYISKEGILLEIPANHHRSVRRKGGYHVLIPDGYKEQFKKVKDEETGKVIQVPNGKLIPDKEKRKIEKTIERDTLFMDNQDIDYKMRLFEYWNKGEAIDAIQKKIHLMFKGYSSRNADDAGWARVRGPAVYKRLTRELDLAKFEKKIATSLLKIYDLISEQGSFPNKGKDMIKTILEKWENNDSDLKLLMVTQKKADGESLLDKALIELFTEYTRDRYKLLLYAHKYATLSDPLRLPKPTEEQINEVKENIIDLTNKKYK